MWFAESKSSIIVFVRNLGIFPWSHARYALARLYTMLRGNPRARNLHGQVRMKIDQTRIYAIPTSEAWYCNARCCAVKKWVPQHRKTFQILNLKKFRVSDNVGRWNDVFPKILIENRPEKCTFQRFPTIVMKFLFAHTRCPAYQTVAKITGFRFVHKPMGRAASLFCKND